MSDTIINIEHGSRTPEQKAVMEKIAADGVCPFCADFCVGNPPKYHTKPILKETEKWVFTENFDPYEGALHHFLLIAKRHITTQSEITSEEWEHVRRLVAWAEEAYELEGAALLLRFGDTNYTGGSVSHLHFQLIAGASKQEGGERLIACLGYQKKK